MSGPEPEPRQQGPSADDLAALRRELAELQQGMRELREARTEPQRREARERVRDAEADLDQLARAAGVSRQALESAMAEAKRAERKEELRPIVLELLAEANEPPPPGDGADGGAGEDDDAGKPAARKPKPAPQRREAKPPPDEPPAPQSHWSDRRVSELMR